MAPNSFSLSSRVRLANELYMPRIHLGVYLTSGRECSKAVRYALDAGYRAIDSAQMYNNERETGEAILDFLSSSSNTTSLKREDIHFTTKLATNSSYQTARKSISQSVKESGLGYIDLFLLHSPYGGKSKRLESWRAVEDAIDAGEVKTGGVSNFGIKHVSKDSHPNIFLIHTHSIILLTNIRHPSSKNSSYRTHASSPPSTKSKSTPSTPAPN